MYPLRHKTRPICVLGMMGGGVTAKAVFLYLETLAKSLKESTTPPRGDAPLEKWHCYLTPEKTLLIQRKESALHAKHVEGYISLNQLVMDAKACLQVSMTPVSPNKVQAIAIFGYTT